MRDADISTFIMLIGTPYGVEIEEVPVIPIDGPLAVQAV